MDKALFERLTQSIAQMDDIVGGGNASRRAPFKSMR